MANQVYRATWYLPQNSAPGLPTNAQSGSNAEKDSHPIQTYAPAATMRLSWARQQRGVCDEHSGQCCIKHRRLQSEQRQSVGDEGL